MITSSAHGEDALARAKRYLLSFEQSQVIDGLALKLAGKPVEAKRAEIKSSADDLAAELLRWGGSPKFIRSVRATFQVLLYEKIAVAEAEAICQPQ
jgi:hypothetical protein